MENRETLFQETKENKKAQRGFTLVELLVVVAIIAILAAIAIPRFTKYKRSAYKDTVRSDIRSAIASVESFFSDYTNLPNDISCGPGPKQCDLTDGTNTMSKALNVSKDVTITITKEICEDGMEGYKIEGKHKQVKDNEKDWVASYDSCTGEYSNF